MKAVLTVLPELIAHDQHPCAGLITRAIATAVSDRPSSRSRAIS
jgi:hypothetical protein